MALRILEKRIESLAPWGDATTDLALTTNVAYIDTSQADPANIVVEEQAAVRIPLVLSTIPDIELARSTLYKARCAEIFGAAPLTAILIKLVAAV